ncbi:MAG: hypothetical protein ACRBCT_08765 [Alphaproteobacteria bacterium]
MIEAVNSVIANASLTRNDANKVDASALQDPNRDIETLSAIAVAENTAGNILATFDSEHGTTVTQVLNPQSGQVLLQFPSESSLETREVGEGAQAAAQVAEQGSTINVGSPPPQDVFVSTFEVLDGNQVSQNAPVNGAAQAEIAINALNVAANSGIAALSTIATSA